MNHSKTQYHLSEALKRLLEKRNFRRISVGDICREAMVSRSAFYVHFADKYQLLEYTINQMLDYQLAYECDHTLDMKLLRLLNGVQQRRNILHNVFMADLDPDVIAIFERTSIRIVSEWLEQMKYISDRENESIRMTVVFYAGGLANVIICWIKENFSTSKEELALCQSRLLMRLLNDEKVKV